MMVKNSCYLFIFSFLLSCGHHLRANHEDLYSEALAIYKSEPDRAVRLLKEYEKANAGNFRKVGKSHWLAGYIYAREEEKRLALINYINALQAYHSLDSADAISKVALDIGNLFLGSRNYELAKRYFRQSIRSAEHNKVLASNYYNLGLLFKNTMHIDSSFYYLNEALLLKQEMGSDRGIANCFNDMGILKWEQGNYTEAILFYRKALRWSENDKRLVNLKAKVLNNIGRAYLSLDMHDQADEYLTAALKVKLTQGLHDQLSFTLNNLAKLADRSGRPELALRYYRKTVSLEAPDKYELETAYMELARRYKGSDLDSAFYFSNAMNELNMSEDVYAKIATEISDRYQLERIQAEFDQRQSEREWREKMWWVIALSLGGLLIIGLLVFLWIQTVKSKARKHGKDYLQKINPGVRFLVELLIYENEENKRTIAEYQKISSLSNNGLTVSKRVAH